MAIKLTDDTKDKIGEQLFKVVSTAVAARGVPITETNWADLGSLHKGDYEPYITEIVTIVENQPQQAVAPPPAPTEEPVAAETFGTTEKPPETAPEPPATAAATQTEPYAIPSAESTVLANTDLGEGVTLSKAPPPREPEPEAIVDDNPLICNLCTDGRVFKNRGGLIGHKRFKHQRAPVLA